MQDTNRYVHSSLRKFLDKVRLLTIQNAGKAMEIMRIDSSGNIGLGTSTPNQKMSLQEQMKEDQLWGNIRRAAKTNPTLHEALERVKITYYLTEDYERRYGNRKT